MARTSVAGRHIEILFADADRIVDVDIDDDDAGLASVVIDAIEHDDPDDAERIIRSAITNGTVKPRP